MSENKNENNESRETYLEIWEILKDKKINIIIDIVGILTAQLIHDGKYYDVSRDLIIEHINRIVDLSLSMQDKMEKKVEKENGK